jgi:hypothetical protein
MHMLCTDLYITADPESTVTRTVFNSIRQIVIGKPANSGYTNLGSTTPFALVGCLAVTNANRWSKHDNVGVEYKRPPFHNQRGSRA